MKYICLVLTVLLSTAVFAENYTLKQDALEVVNRLDGVMTSADQSLSDLTYFDVTLDHCKINVNNMPEELKGSTFFYLRQAISLSKAAPYRKRIVRVAPDFSVDAVSTTNYKPLNQLSFDGICDLPESERYVDYKKDIGKAICTTYLTRQDDLFVGGTPPEGCPNTKGGAVKATSDVVLAKTWMSSWDRGWNADDQQVWGATEGPYIFKKVTGAFPDPFAFAFGGLIVGSFSNEKQAKDFPNKFKLSQIEMCQAKFSNGQYRSGKLFIYREQTVAGNSSSEVFEIAADQMTGSVLLTVREFAQVRNPHFCSQAETLKFNLSPEAVNWNKGCTIDINYDRDINIFTGQTAEGGCRSTLPGTAYKTVEVKIVYNKIKILTKWFDAEGNQISGLDEPYEFLKVE